MTKPSELFVSQSLSSYDFCEPTEGNYLIRFSYYPKGSRPSLKRVKGTTDTWKRLRSGSLSMPTTTSCLLLFVSSPPNCWM